MNKAVFLDRDGVINHVEPGKYVTKVEDFKILPGVIGALKRFKRLGYLIIIITNQFGIYLGKATEQDVNAIHEHMKKEFEKFGITIDAIYVCPDYSSDRKPKLGMFVKAIRDWNIDVKESYVIGDSLSDLVAADTLGCRSILVKSPLSPTIAANLLEASKVIENETKNSNNR